MTKTLYEQDLALIGLSLDETGERASFQLGPPLLRHDGTLYGGTAIAASVMSMEAATGRDVRWITTQFVRSADSGSLITLQADVLAGGKRTSQVRTDGIVDGEIVFVSLGSVGAAKPDGLTGTYEQMPEVAPPEEAPGMMPGPPGMSPGDTTFIRLVEYRQAQIRRSPREGSGTMALWARFADDRTMTPAGVAFVADMVPVSIARGAGRAGAGVSLDNSLRFGDVAAADARWVLLEMQGHMSAGGYGHGTVRVWSPEGKLLAVGGQTANMIYLFD